MKVFSWVPLPFKLPPGFRLMLCSSEHFHRGFPVVALICLN